MVSTHSAGCNDTCTRRHDLSCPVRMRDPVFRRYIISEMAGVFGNWCSFDGVGWDDPSDDGGVAEDDPPEGGNDGIV